MSALGCSAKTRHLNALGRVVTSVAKAALNDHGH